MALVKCPECGKEISDAAASCPHCGFVGQGAMLIEETSKRLKGDLILSALIVIVGLLIAIAGGASGGSIVFGALIMAGGFAWFIATRFRIWWHHK